MQLRDVINLDDKTAAELDMMRSEILGRAPDGDFSKLSDDDLHMLAAITQQMRRKSAGPPKTAKPKAAKVQATLDML